MMDASRHPAGLFSLDQALSVFVIFLKGFIVEGGLVWGGVTVGMRVGVMPGVRYRFYRG